MAEGEQFSKQLRKYMAKAVLTPRELARMTDLSESTVYRYLSENRIPHGTQLLKLARALSVTADELLGTEPPEGALREGVTYAVGMEALGESVLVPFIGAASAGNGTCSPEMP